MIEFLESYNSVTVFMHKETDPYETTSIRTKTCQIDSGIFVPFATITNLASLLNSRVLNEEIVLYNDAS